MRTEGKERRIRLATWCKSARRERRKRDDESIALGDIHKRWRDFHDHRRPSLSITPPHTDAWTGEIPTIPFFQAATVAMAPTPSKRIEKFVLPLGPPMLQVTFPNLLLKGVKFYKKTKPLNRATSLNNLEIVHENLETGCDIQHLMNTLSDVNRINYQEILSFKTKGKTMLR